MARSSTYVLILVYFSVEVVNSPKKTVDSTTILTIWARVAGKRILVYDYVYKKYQKEGNMIKEYEGQELKDGMDDILDSELDDREKLLQVLRKIRKEPLTPSPRSSKPWPTTRCSESKAFFFENVF